MIIRIFLSLCSSVLLVFSFPLFDFEFLSWIAFVPLFLVIRNKGLKSTIGLSFLTGFCFFMGVFYWINLVTGFTLLHFFMIMIYLGLYFAFFGLLLNLTSHKWKFPFILTAPVLWILIEYVRAHAGFMELPLALLGHSQYQEIPLLQLASFTGVYGISFLIMLANAAIADLIGHLNERKAQGTESSVYSHFYRAGGVLLIVMMVWIAGWQTLTPEVSGQKISVAVIQGNIPQERKWDRQYRQQIISKQEGLTEVAAESKPQIIIWPEASTPGLVLKDITLYQQMVSMVRRINTYLLIGSAEYPKFDEEATKLKRSGNTALFFSPKGEILGQYLKIRLLPFGEYAPLERVVTWPDFIIPQNRMNFNVAGKNPKLFSLDGKKFGTLICWEIIFPELSRRFVTEGAGFLANISNEAWFGESAFPYQFLTTCVFRAVENRVNLVRATNTGISCFIDPYGRVTGRVTNGGKDIFVEGTLTKDIFLSPPGTFYTRYGDVFAYGCIAFSVGLVIWSILKKR